MLLVMVKIVNCVQLYCDPLVYDLIPNKIGQTKNAKTAANPPILCSSSSFRIEVALMNNTKFYGLSCGHVFKCGSPVTSSNLGKILR